MTDNIRWSKLPYAGETTPPNNPVDSFAGSWPTYFFQNDGRGTFRDYTGKAIDWNLLDPLTVDFNKELNIVKRVQKHITKKQIRIAKYWGTGAASKQWTPILDRLIDAYDVSPTTAARILSIVHAGMNDAFVVTWYYKYRYDIARPNQLDPKLKTILCTPRFPSYPSGHSVIAGCVEKTLGYFFPAKAAILKKFAEENAHSRLLAGVHFPIDNEQGLLLGRRIGDYIVSIVKTQRGSNGQPIDIAYEKKLPVKLLPPPYRQMIPYNFEDGRISSICGCQSSISPKTKCLCKKKRKRRKHEP